MNNTPIEDYEPSSDISDEELVNNDGWENVGTIRPQYDLQESIVFSLRLPKQLVDEILTMANKRKIKPRTYARQALELGMSMHDDASLDVLATVFQQLVNTASTSGVLSTKDKTKSTNTSQQNKKQAS